MASGAEQEIRRRIQQSGPMTFREFMELALYWPVGGYYTTRSASSDYYTAPAAHPAFGALMCLQLYQMWHLLEEPYPFWVVEPGAGNGLLERDVTTLASQWPDGFGRALRYVCLETHPLREGYVAPATGRRHPDWLAAVGLPFQEMVGVVLSNELLDAFPVHRVKMEHGRLQEIYVTLKDERLAEKLGPLSTPALAEWLQKVGASLAEGWEAEVNLAVDDWVAQAALCLERGFVITVDYGRSADQLYSGERPRGTLTTFRDHVQTDSPLRDVGYQDITAQVDFTAMELAGIDIGLECWGRTSQRRFLLNMGMQRWLSSVSNDLNQAEANANRMGMQQLVRPSSMGDFQVMFQTKGVGRARLWGLWPSPELDALLATVTPPQLTPEHKHLLGASYPHLAQSYEYLWPGGDAT